jgi:hypothetical protein
MLDNPGVYDRLWLGNNQASNPIVIIYLYMYTYDRLTLSHPLELSIILVKHLKRNIFVTHLLIITSILCDVRSLESQIVPQKLNDQRTIFEELLIKVSHSEISSSKPCFARVSGKRKTYSLSASTPPISIKILVKN